MVGRSFYLIAVLLLNPLVVSASPECANIDLRSGKYTGYIAELGEGHSCAVVVRGSEIKTIPGGRTQQVLEYTKHSQGCLLVARDGYPYPEVETEMIVNYSGRVVSARVTDYIRNSGESMTCIIDSN